VSPCHFDAHQSCTITIELTNTGPGCATNIRGLITQYRDTQARPLIVVASTHFNEADLTLTPKETVLINARFPTFSFDALGRGDYCPFAFVTPFWNDMQCP
jgi:hypothetical protein